MKKARVNYCAVTKSVVSLNVRQSDVSTVNLGFQFHPIAFMISNQETEADFTHFFQSIVNLGEAMDIEVDPDYIMIDASDATYNAAAKVFPYSTILMCFFHVMKNVRSNCRKPLNDELYGELLDDMRYLHMRKSVKEFDEAVDQFRRKWNKKKTKSVYEYCNSWFFGNYSKWQIYHSPPGWASTNSNIESFNATIKRDFSLRRRYSVYSSVSIIQQIINYYSTNKSTFHTKPKFDSKTHELGKRCASVDVYKKKTSNEVLCRDKYIIKIKTRCCSCRYFIKHAVCSHILGFLYKNPSYDSENWFGVKYSGLPTNFAVNTKKEPKKKL